MPGLCAEVAVLTRMEIAPVPSLSPDALLCSCTLGRMTDKPTPLTRAGTEQSPPLASPGTSPHLLRRLSEAPPRLRRLAVGDCEGQLSQPINANTLAGLRLGWRRTSAEDGAP
jgi:hypothetical protein